MAGYSCDYTTLATPYRAVTFHTDATPSPASRVHRLSSSYRHSDQSGWMSTTVAPQGLHDHDDGPTGESASPPALYSRPATASSSATASFATPAPADASGIYLKITSSHCPLHPRSSAPLSSGCRVEDPDRSSDVADNELNTIGAVLLSSITAHRQ